jgi:hypothetical protein
MWPRSRRAVVGAIAAITVIAATALGAPTAIADSGQCPQLSDPVCADVPGGFASIDAGYTAVQMPDDWTAAFGNQIVDDAQSLLASTISKQFAAVGYTLSSNATFAIDSAAPWQMYTSSITDSIIGVDLPITFKGVVNVKGGSGNTQVSLASTAVVTLLYNVRTNWQTQPSPSGISFDVGMASFFDLKQANGNTNQPVYRYFTFLLGDPTAQAPIVETGQGPALSNGAPSAQFLSASLLRGSMIAALKGPVIASMSDEIAGLAECAANWPLLPRFLGAWLAQVEYGMGVSFTDPSAR